MNSSEKIQYLVNVLVLARVDREVAPEEHKLVDVIRRTIGASAQQLQEAWSRAAREGIDLTPFRRLSSRVRNLEDMISMALADHRLVDEERFLLKHAAQKVGVDQDQINLIISEAKARGGTVIAVATEGDEEIADKADRVIYIPAASQMLNPILIAVPMQMLAYCIAVRRGCDVDQPRNLAKSVTVE